MIRFKEFINNETKLIKLKDSCSFFSGGTPSSSNKNYYTGNIPFIRSGEIHKNDTELRINETALNNSSAKMVNKGDLLLALYGATSGEIDISQVTGAINQAILCIRPNDKINKYYLKYKLEFEKDNILKTYLQGGQGNLSAEIIKNLSYNFPSINDQTKVSSFLSLLDKKIELQSKKIEDLKLFKKGLIKKFFSEDNLKQIKIKEIGKIVTGTTPSKSINSYWDNGNIIWVTPTDISYNRDISDSIFKITDSGLKNGRFIPKNSILVTCIASIGKNAVLKVDGSCNQQINAIIPNKDFNYNYIYYLLESISNYMKSIAGTSATSIINKDDFSKIVVKTHSKEKQDYIASIMSQFENKIVLENSKLSKLCKLKKGLMQNMFV